MGGNNVFIGLLKQVSFYKRSTAFFVLVAIAGLGTFGYFNSLKAASPVSIADQLANPGSVLALTLSPNGDLYDGNIKLPAQIFTTNNTYRYRYQVISNPTSFIDQMQITVTLPEASDGTDVSSNFINNGGASSVQSRLLDSQTLLYTAYGVGSQAQLAVEFEIPKSFVTPSPLFNIRQQLSALSPVVWMSISLGLPALTLLILLLVTAARFRSIDPISEELKDLPSRLPPALLGILIRGHLTSRDLAATFIHLAMRGHLVIRQFSYLDFRFRRAKGSDNLEDYEELLLTQIFGPSSDTASSEEISFSLAQEVFSKRVSQSFVLAYKKMNELGYFFANPLSQHIRYQIASIILFILGLAGFFTNVLLVPDVKYSLLAWASMMAVSALIYYFAKSMPTRTIYGDRELARWLSFRKYLTGRTPVNYIAQSQEQYLSYLPYAVVFEAETEWTWRFYDAPFIQPAWYIAPNIATIDQFANSLFPLFGYLSHALSLSAAPATR